MKRVVPSVVLLVLFWCPSLLPALAQGSAGVGGVVRDLHGTPQMGALIELLGPDATVIARTFTDDHGRYLLRDLTPGRYDLRASGALLVPALRSDLRLAAGVRALANLTMTAVFEVGVWFPAEKRTADEPVDDWRWTLRSSANRPLLRVAGDDPADNAAVAGAGEKPKVAFRQATATVLSGDGGFGEGGTHEVVSLDRTTANGVAEMFQGDIAEGALRNDPGSIALSGGLERQTAFGGDTRMVVGVQSRPEIAGPALAGRGTSGLQTVSLATSERIVLGDAVMIDAGTLLLAEHLAASRAQALPFLRVVFAPAEGVTLTYRLATDRRLQSSTDLDSPQMDPEVLSDAAGRPILERATHQELTAAHVSGANTETLTLFQDDLPVSALEGGGLLPPAELEGLPVVTDAGTGTLRVAVSGHVAHGVSVTLAHQFAPSIRASLAADVGSTLVRNDGPLALATLGSEVHTRMAPAITAELQGEIARSETKFRVQYRWQSSGTLEAVNSFDAAPRQAFLSAYLRQRLWSGHRLQGVDAVLEATNLLEEGYQPMVGPDGQTLFLAQAPRALRAGLSFTF